MTLKLITYLEIKCTALGDSSYSDHYSRYSVTGESQEVIRCRCGLTSENTQVAQAAIQTYLSSVSVEPGSVRKQNPQSTRKQILRIVLAQAVRQQNKREDNQSVWEETILIVVLRCQKTVETSVVQARTKIEKKNKKVNKKKERKREQFLAYKTTNREKPGYKQTRGYI